MSTKKQSTAEFIRQYWPFESEQSQQRLLFTLTYLRISLGFTYNDTHKYFERALKRPIAVSDFDLVMQRADEAEAYL